MREQQIARRLAAILAADISGYSRIMGVRVLFRDHKYHSRINGLDDFWRSTKKVDFWPWDHLGDQMLLLESHRI